GAQVRPDLGDRLDLPAKRLAMDAAPFARRLARRKLELSHDTELLAIDDVMNTPSWPGSPQLAQRRPERVRRRLDLVERRDDSEPSARKPAHRDAAIGERSGQRRRARAGVDHAVGAEPG